MTSNGTVNMPMWDPSCLLGHRTSPRAAVQSVWGSAPPASPAHRPILKRGMGHVDADEMARLTVSMVMAHHLGQQGLLRSTTKVIDGMMREEALRQEALNVEFEHRYERSVLTATLDDCTEHLDGLAVPKARVRL